MLSPRPTFPEHPASMHSTPVDCPSLLAATWTRCKHSPTTPARTFGSALRSNARRGPASAMIPPVTAHTTMPLGAPASPFPNHRIIQTISLPIPKPPHPLSRRPLPLKRSRQRQDCRGRRQNSREARPSHGLPARSARIGLVSPSPGSALAGKAVMAAPRAGAATRPTRRE